MKKVIWTALLLLPVASGCGDGADDTGGDGSTEDGGADDGATSDDGDAGDDDGPVDDAVDDDSSDDGTSDDSDSDDGVDDDGVDDDTGKPSATSIKYAANGIECGLTDGYADQQHNLPHLIHLNTDKCNGESYRPTFTLYFESGKDVTPGTYAVAGAAGPNAVQIVSEQYNFTSWDGTSGSVVVTTNGSDATKLDIKLDSITMTNREADDPLNPATDTVTGYIIGI